MVLRAVVSKTAPAAVSDFQSPQPGRSGPATTPALRGANEPQTRAEAFPGHARSRAEARSPAGFAGPFCGHRHGAVCHRGDLLARAGFARFARRIAKTRDARTR